MRNFFLEINNETSCKEMRRFNENKAPQKSELLKTTPIFFAKRLCETVYSVIKTSNFPSSLKFADIILYIKETGKTTKKTRHVGILPTLLKIFERIFFELMLGFFDNFLSEQ